MAVMIRLARGGTKKKPFYHLVVANKEACRDGKYLQRVGTYNPKAKPEERVKANMTAIEDWIKKGAKVSETVGHLLKAAPKSK